MEVQTINVFTEEDKKFNKEIIQRAGYDTNENNSTNSTKKSSTDNYFKDVNNILNAYRKRWEIV